MTLDTFLFRPDNLTVFELGSGSWSACMKLAPDGPVWEPATPPEPYLFEVPSSELWKAWILRSGVTQGDTDDAYLNEVIARLERFCAGAQRLWACHDDGDRFPEAFDEGYKLAGSRYARRVGPWWLEAFNQRSWATHVYSPAHTVHAWDRARRRVVTIQFEEGQEDGALDCYRDITEAQLEAHEFTTI